MRAPTSEWVCACGEEDLEPRGRLGAQHPFPVADSKETTPPSALSLDAIGPKSHASVSDLPNVPADALNRLTQPIFEKAKVLAEVFF